MNAAYCEEAQPGMLSPKLERPPIYEPYRAPQDFSSHDALAYLQNGLQQNLRSMFEARETIDRLKQLFVIGQSAQQFLFERRALPILLLESAPHLRHAFGEDVTFQLKVSFDEAGARTLYAVVLWAGRLADVRAAQERFDRDWWIATVQRSAGYLTFTYELV